MTEPIMKEMINNDNYCIIEDGDEKIIHVRPDLIKKSLNNKLKQEDIEQGFEITDKTIKHSMLCADLHMDCFNKNCSGKCKGLRTVPNGNVTAKYMFLNKQPTKYETAMNTCMCDRSGIFISLIFSKLNIDRSQIYFTDVIKCINQLNESSFKECIESYLTEEIKIVSPEIIICNGMSVLKTCSSIGIFKGLPDKPSYGNIYECVFDGKPVKAVAIYDLEKVLEKEGEDYNKCKGELWKQLLNIFIK